MIAILVLHPAEVLDTPLLTWIRDGAPPEMVERIVREGFYFIERLQIVAFANVSQQQLGSSLAWNEGGEV